jgi:hypothetical protein
MKLAIISVDHIEQHGQPVQLMRDPHESPSQRPPVHIALTPVACPGAIARRPYLVRRTAQESNLCRNRVTKILGLAELRSRPDRKH